MSLVFVELSTDSKMKSSLLMFYMFVFDIKLFIFKAMNGHNLEFRARCEDEVY